MPLPKPKTGEDRQKFISRCISFAVGDGMPQDQAVAACHTSWRKAKGIKPKESNGRLFLEYSVPIKSRAELDGEFTIDGIAINETTTTNGHKFLGEELKESASTLIGVPLLKDHENSVDAIVGKVSKAHFDETLHNIPFKAIVKDLSMKQKIKDGLINSVSVGAFVDPKNIEETEDGEIIPHGIIFKELSLVAVGADPAATFGVALNNAYKGLKSHSQDENLQSIERGDINMTDTEEEKKEEAKEEKEETEEKVEEEKKETKVKTEESAFERGFKAGLAVKESDIDENREEPKSEKKEEPKEEPKPEKKEEKEETEEAEEDEEVEEEGNYNFKQGYNSFSAERKSYVYN